MSRAAFDTLLGEARKVHMAHPALDAFCPFPDDVTAQEVTPYHVPASDLMQAETGLRTHLYGALRDAFVGASPHAHWRETYKNTDIGDDFMARFGCYCLIGEEGPFTSEKMRAWVVYMPPGLHYPWHHHPGEEMYLILAGEAEFLRRGCPGARLGPGDVSEHAANQPHATETHDQPLMAYVVWRNGFGVPPVLTPREATV